MDESNENILNILSEINSKLDKLLDEKKDSSLSKTKLLSASPDTDDDIQSLFQIDDKNHIHFLHEILGNKVPDQQFNGTVICLTIKHKFTNTDTIGSVELGEFLTRQGIPTKNLARSLKKYKNYLIQKGKAGKSVTYTITRPGLIKGNQLLNSYSERNKNGWYRRTSNKDK